MGVGVIRAYHEKGMVPLMMCTLPLYLMVPGTSLEGMALTEVAPSDGEVTRCMKDAMEPTKDAVIAIAYPVPSHPPMRPEPGFVRLVSLLFVFLLFVFLISL
jgi:hypothetical protein